MSSELYSIGDRHYFGYNGKLFRLAQPLLLKVLDEVANMNPLECAKYLIEQAENNRFIQMSK